MADTVQTAETRPKPRKGASPVKRLLETLTRPFQKSSKKGKKKGNPNIYPLY